MSMLTKQAYDVVIFAGISSKEDTDLKSYRSGNFIGLNKLTTVHIQDKPLIRVILDEYLHTQTSDAYIQNVHIWGATEGIQSYITPRESGRVILRPQNSSFGEKILQLGEFKSDQVIVAANDVAPFREHMARYLSLISEHRHNAAIIPAIPAGPLLANGFRSHDKDKLYAVISPDGTRERVAFPQMYAFKPNMLYLDEISRFADRVFKNREHGLKLLGKVLLGIIDLGPTFWKGLPRIAMTGYGMNEWLWKGLTPSMTGVSKAARPAFIDSSALAHISLLEDAYTIAMDVDCERERQVLERVYATRH